MGAGLGTATALANMMSTTEGNPAVELNSVMVALAYLLTLVPFFHGAMLFMDYNLDRCGRVALLVNFWALFGQTVLFFVMAEFVKEPTSFALTWVSLLVLDIVWVIWLATTLRTDQPSGHGPYIRWATINILTVALLLAVVGSKDWPLGPNLDLALFLVAIAAGRTAADYYFSRDFYFDRKPSITGMTPEAR